MREFRFLVEPCQLGRVPHRGDLADSSVMVTVDEVRRVALGLPRTTEHLIRSRVKFRVKQLVYVAFSLDETLMGFAFPKDERAALVESEPDKFLLPSTTDLRFNWVEVRTAVLDIEEMTELVTDAWTMVVPKRVVRDCFNDLGS
jgi:hypothetical protein